MTCPSALFSFLQNFCLLRLIPVCGLVEIVTDPVVRIFFPYPQAKTRISSAGR
jgi:hypothetical protein